MIKVQRAEVYNTLIINIFISYCGALHLFVPYKLYGYKYCGALHLFADLAKFYIVPKFNFMKFLLICCMLCGVCPAIAQLPPQIANYHNLIDRAEISIVDSAYERALTQYDSAFAALKSPYASDFYNALQCALILKKDKKTLDYANKLVEKGFTMAFFQYKFCFTRFRQQQEFLNFIENYPQHHAIYQKKVNWELRARLDKMFTRDQFLRKQDPAYKIFKDSIHILDKKNLAEMKTIIKKYGFPNEDLIGIKYEMDTIIMLANLPYDIVLRHFYQNKWYDLTPILLAEVEKGRMHPRNYAAHQTIQLGYEKKKGYGNEPFIEFDDMIVQEDFAPDAMQTIQTNREKLNLCSYAHFVKKMAYHHFTDSRFVLVPYSDGNIAKYSGVNSSALKGKVKATTYKRMKK